MARAPFKLRSGNASAFKNLGSSPAKQEQSAYTISSEEKKKLNNSGRRKSTALGDKVTAAISSVIGGKTGLFKNPEDKSYKELKKEARSKYSRYVGQKVKVKKITADEFTK